MDSPKGRIWLVGNGPSLAHTPLDMLIGETTFAMNTIRLMYDKTAWRPDLYWLVDWSAMVPEYVWRENIRVHAEMGIPMWILKDLRDGYPVGHSGHDELPSGVGELPNTTWVERCPKHHFYAWDNIKQADHWHLPEICTAMNAISGMMQVAVMLGYGPIYLVGCDLGYVKDKTKNHFDPDYHIWEKRDLHEQFNNNALKAHQNAARSCPVPIYNASLGGHLEVHPRVDFYEVLACKEPG